MKYLVWLFILPFIILLTSCPSSTSSGTYLTVEADANVSTPATAGALVSKTLQQYSGIPLHSGGFLTSPTGFYIDIREVKVRGDTGDWITLKSMLTGSLQNIISPYNVVNSASISASDLSTFSIAYGINWYVSTNNINITNSTASDTFYCLIGSSSMIYNITNNESTYRTASTYSINKSYSLFNGSSYTLHLNFNSLNTIEIVTDSSGTITAAYLYSPTLSVDIQ